MKMRFCWVAAALALVGGSSLAATAAHATSPLVALTGDKTLITIDRDKRRVSRTVTVNAIPTAILAIDIRPADGLLYALTTTTVYVVTPNNGAATVKSTLNPPLPAGTYAADFNPVANLLRVVGTNGSNYRVNVDTGAVTADTALAFAGLPPANPFGSTTPNVVAVAYTNGFAGTKSTLLYDIDKASAALFLQLPPNGGTLNAVGALGSKLNDVGFDIEVDSNMRNRGLVVGNRRLWQIDLAGGKVTSVGQIKNLKVAVRDIAAMPD